MEHFAITHFDSVLVVDDDPVCREYTSEALRQAGKSVKHAADIADALRLALEELPELILTDLHLADGDGAELVRRIRAAWPASRPIPVCVAMTAAKPERCRAMFGDGVFAGVLRKPFRPAQLNAVAEGTRSKTPRNAAATPAGANAGLHRSAVAELRAGLARLARLVEERRRDRAAALAHRLAGVAAVCDEGELKRCLRTLSEACASDSPGEMADAFVAARRAAGDVIARTGRSG